MGPWFFAVLSNSSHLEFLTKLNFTVLMPCSLIMQHMKFENHGCSRFIW